MDYPSNYTPSNTLRLEIAICQQDIDVYEPGVVDFIIPALVPDTISTRSYTPNYNIVNKNTISTQSIGATSIDNIIKLKVPKEYTRWYGESIIPAGTRFIVAFIGANINDIRIIGRYDSFDD